MYYINIFFIYSLLGFLFENAMKLVTHSNFNSGILHGPWTFIYGIAIFVIMAFYKFLSEYKLKKWIEVLIFYICVTIFMTLIEFSGGMLIEKLFHVVYWDYSSLKFNYGHYISLETSLLWGVFATFVNYFITPIINKFEKKIPIYLTIIFVIFFIIDIII